MLVIELKVGIDKERGGKNTVQKRWIYLEIDKYFVGAFRRSSR